MFALLYAAPHAKPRDQDAPEADVLFPPAHCFLCEFYRDPLIARASRYIKIINDDLTLQGLEIVWRRNRTK